MVGTRGKGRGANIVYEKDGHFIRTRCCEYNYIAVTKYTKILPNNSYVTYNRLFPFFKFKNKRGEMKLELIIKAKKSQA